MLINLPLRSLLILAATTLFSSAAWTQSTATTEIAGINLSQLREMGFRIDWINQSTATGLRMPTITNKSLYAVDNEDYLTRYDLETGKWLWSTPAGNQVFKLRSINESSNGVWAYVVSDGAIYIIEASTGNYPSRGDNDRSQGKMPNVASHLKPHIELEWVANTPAITNKDLLIYGSNTGDAVWFDPSIGFIENRYRIGSSVHVKPTLVHGVRDEEGALRRAIITPAADGSVIAVDANRVTQIWMLKLLDAVETPIACDTNHKTLDGETIPRTSVFISGSDQYLRSVDMHTGKPRWKVLCTSPLTDTAVLHDGSLYQRVPQSGLMCFKAFPQTSSGELLWIAENVSGNVITTNSKGRLICWDSSNRILQVVDTRLGGVVSTLPIPNAKSLIADNDVMGSLYIITEDDMLLRLVSRNW